MSPKIYLDNNATTKVHAQVLKTMMPVFVNNYANCSSSHCMGREADAKLQQSRQTVARLLNVHPNQVHFTSGATEANNIVIRSTAPGNAVLFSAVEHASVWKPCKELSRRWESIAVNDQGQVTEEKLRNAFTMLGKTPSLVCIMLANNEVGSINSIPSLARVVHNLVPGCHFHCDATQYAGRWTLDLQALGADSISMSAHKFHGPRGIGVLWSRRPLKCCTLGGRQEHGLRAGTENLPGIVGLAVAMEINEIGRAHV